jgi:hypothetical protein
MADGSTHPLVNETTVIKVREGVVRPPRVFQIAPLQETRVSRMCSVLLLW